MSINYETPPPPGNSKYPEMLASIKADQLENPGNRELWAYINEFTSEGTARDLAYRLGKVHDEFEFIGRKGDDVTVVYARLKAGVAEAAEKVEKRPW